MSTIMGVSPAFPVPPFTGWGNDGVTDRPANRFVNLESLEDRIIFYLLSPLGKTEEQMVQVHNLWKCLYYPKTEALCYNVPGDKSEWDFYKENIVPLISRGQEAQETRRVFRSPYMDDAMETMCTMLKVYVDSVIPVNLYLSQVNIGIDCVCHNKLVNVTSPEKDESTFIAEVEGEKFYVETKSRISVMIKAVLSLLNGADVQGVGVMQFNYEKFMYNESRYALWNNRNFEGQKVVIGCLVGGVA